MLLRQAKVNLFHVAGCFPCFGFCREVRCLRLLLESSVLLTHFKCIVWVARLSHARKSWALGILVKTASTRCRFYSHGLTFLTSEALSFTDSPFSFLFFSFLTFCNVTWEQRLCRELSFAPSSQSTPECGARAEKSRDNDRKLYLQGSIPFKECRNINKKDLVCRIEFLL